MSREIALSVLAQIDREIEDAMGRIMNGEATPGEYGRVSDLAARRVELTEPAAFAELERLLAVPLLRSRSPVGSAEPTVQVAGERITQDPLPLRVA